MAGNTVNSAMKAVSQMARGAGGLNEYMKDTAKEMGDVSRALQQGNLAGAAAEMLDVISPGSQLARTLDSLGILPDDPVIQNLFSASVNFAMAGTNPMALAAAYKDLNDARLAMGGRPCPIARPHCPPPPGLVLQNLLKDIGSFVGEIEHPKCRGYPKLPQLHHHHHHLVHHHMLRPGCGPKVWHDWMMRHPPIMQPPMQAIRDAIDRLVGDALKNAGVSQEGPPVKDKPMAERSISDIVNDKSLCFEDMVAMVMAKVAGDMQKQVEQQIQKLEKMTAQKDAAAAGKSGGAGQAGGTGQAGGAGQTEGSGGAGGASQTEGSSQAEGGQSARGAEGKGGDDLLWRGLDFLLMGPVVSLIGQGLTGGSLSKQALGMLGDNPELLNGMIDGAKALTPILTPLVTAAVAAIPGVGPIIAPFVPMAMPFVMEGLGQTVKAAAGAASESSGAGNPNPAAGNPNAQGAGSSGNTEAANGTGGTEGTGESGKTEGKDAPSQDSINIEMEKLKLLMQRMQEMQQAMSNVLNNMHEGAMNAIRNIK